MKRKLVHTDSTDSDDLGVLELVHSKRGRKFLLGEELDGKVQALIKNIREAGGVVRAAGNTIVLSHDRSMLLESGGGIEILDKSYLKQNEYDQKKGHNIKENFRC